MQLYKFYGLIVPSQLNRIKNKEDAPSHAMPPCGYCTHSFINYGRIFDNKVVYEHTSLMMLIRFSCRLVLYWLILLYTYQFVNLNFRSYYMHYERFGQIVLDDSKSSFSSSIRYQLLDSLFFL